MFPYTCKEYHVNLYIIGRQFFYSHAASSSSFLLRQKNKVFNNDKSLKNTHKPPPIPLDGHRVLSSTYESLDNGDPLDYTYPQPSPTTVSGSSPSHYTYIMNNPEVASQTFISDEDTLYHAVGPNTKQWTTTINPGSRSTSPPQPPPVPLRNGIRRGNFYNVMKMEEENSSVQYEDPTLPKFRVRLIVCV